MLAGHFEGVDPEKDVVLIAFHQGKAYSVTAQDADWTNVSQIAANLQHYVADAEHTAFTNIPQSLF